MNASAYKYSIVVPLYNEQGAAADLHREIVAVMSTLRDSYEIIFVDDGSNDNTFGVLQQLRPLHIIRFRKNFGQTAALDAGIKAASGEIIITMDGDGQDIPQEIPRLLALLQQGYDVVAAWRYRRKDSFQKRFISLGANFLRSFLVYDHVHDAGCQFRVYRRECFEGLDLHGEMHRFIPAILYWNGFRIGEVQVEHRARLTGTTKYNWKRIVKGFIDMCTVWFWRKFANRPLHLFGALGFLLLFVGVGMGVTLIILRMLELISLQDTIWPLFSFFLVLAGIQLFISGLLADILVKVYYRQGMPAYRIKEVICND